jgi:hypothetical protein
VVGSLSGLTLGFLGFLGCLGDLPAWVATGTSVSTEVLMGTTWLARGRGSSAI